MQVLIFGGTGLIGRCIAKELCLAGHTCLIPTRGAVGGARGAQQNQKQGSSLPNKEASRGKISYVKFSLESVDELLGQADWLINLAGESLTGFPISKKKREKIFSSRVALTQKIAECLEKRKSPLKLWINASAIGYYDEASRAVVDEDSKPGDHFMSRLCIEWEKPLLKRVFNMENQEIRRVILRIPLVLSKDGGLLKQMLPIYKLGLGAALGDGRQGFSWIHIHDLQRIIFFVLEKRDLSGVINASSPYPVEQRLFSFMLAKYLKRVHFLKIPKVFLRLLLAEFSSLLLEGVFVLPRKLTQHEFTYTYPNIEAALEDLIEKPLKAAWNT